MGGARGGGLQRTPTLDGAGFRGRVDGADVVAGRAAGRVTSAEGSARFSAEWSRSRKGADETRLCVCVGVRARTRCRSRGTISETLRCSVCGDSPGLRSEPCGPRAGQVGSLRVRYR